MRFTIAIPAYKKLFLKEAVQSCLNQSFEDFELIVLDDASPENLADVLGSFDDSRIRKFNNGTNVGAFNVVNNWNKCLELARGEYFICIGDDDVLMPACLELYNSCILKFPQVNVFHMRTQIINEKSEVVSTMKERPEQEDVCSFVLERWKGRLQYLGDFCYKTSTLKESGGFVFLPLAWGSDDVTAARAAFSGGIVNCNVPGFQYRVNRLSISSSGNMKVKFEALLLEAAWYLSFFSKNSGIVKMAEPHFRKKSEDHIYDALKGEWEYCYWRKKARQAGISPLKYEYISMKALLKRIIVKLI